MFRQLTNYKLVDGERVQNSMSLSLSRDAHTREDRERSSERKERIRANFIEFRMKIPPPLFAFEGRIWPKERESNYATCGGKFRYRSKCSFSSETRASGGNGFAPREPHPIELKNDARGGGGVGG